ncbi:diguanylate cyclase [uncultured Thiocystis sp.]|jgi:diguanylate cyclase (GGDEF)-like protein|uniref:diguanylate cyclase n=1 Tax=uncultured Thiocystis sp. TaxID=1202134 RepID=UPI0025FE096C|nr:diguanylate cyclase [uncultured Thiocystis sp.]
MTTMNSELTHLDQADTGHALEIAPRVWWVGHVLDDDVFQCHVYLLEQGDQSVLFDPGSRLTFPGTLRKIEEVIPFTRIRYFVCHHQDPDITAALPLIDEMTERPDAVIVTHWRAETLLKHYGLRMPFWLVDQHDWRLTLDDRELRFVFTPYAHFPGAFCTFDPSTGVLFSSDLYGGFTARPTLVAQDESHFEALRPFHEHYMPSRDILNYALSRIEQYPVKIIAAQHGSVIPERLVPYLTDKLKHLDCGIYLFAQGNTDIQRLSHLNQTLREITQTMLLYRDFRDIAERLFHVVNRNLPVARIDYYARLEDGTLLTLSHETRFSGVVGDAPPEVLALLGKTQAQWAEAHAGVDPAIQGHTLHAGTFCSRHTEDGDLVVTLPLFSPQSQCIEAAALIYLHRETGVSPEEEQVIQQIAMPLQVALEREMIYRSIESKRKEAYQRSIRDPLTGLFTRVYMQDVMERQCSLHDRDENALVSALMIDVDHFKAVNDTYGHPAGDEVLRQVATVMRQVIRDSDIPVRFGGEEFVLFLVGTTRTDAGRYAERIRSAIATHAFAVNRAAPIPITVSLGLAFRNPFESLDSLILRADEALYRAKQAGRNRCEIAMTQGSGGDAG